MYGKYVSGKWKYVCKVVYVSVRVRVRVRVLVACCVNDCT